MENRYNQNLTLYETGDGAYLDLLDLKVSLINFGIRIDEEIYETFEGTARLSRSPYSCNSLILDGQVSCSLSRTDRDTPFRLALSAGKPVVTCNGNFVAEVAFHGKTTFYEQQTSGGIPFGYLAVLQGWDMLAFSCLWLCEITQSGNACGFCHTGNLSTPTHSLAEMMEVVRYAVEESPKIKILQMTAGSTFNTVAEVDKYVDMLKAIDKTVGLDKAPTTIFLTPPSDLKQIDRLFDAGVSCIACDIDIWDEELFNKICPGKAKITTRKRYLDALHYIADKYGPNRACCVFVAGIEPVDSLLEGATALAGRGIVPLPSPLMPFAIEHKTLAAMQPFSTGYYRTVRKEIAKLYGKHDLIVPGTYGSDVCLSRDIWLRRDVLAAE